MINLSVNRLLPLKFWLMLAALTITATFVFFLCLFFEPRWMSNDDIGMSMVAHGYGIAAIGLPNLVFSNVLWGYFVRTIPEINGVLGYSIATLSVLVIVGSVIIYGLYQSGADYIVCLSVLVLILVRPILFPQFTINAGLLMVGAIICWHLYTRQNDKQMLLIGCLLAFCSYLVRDQEFLLILLVALPLLSWRILFLHRFAKVVFLVLIVAIAVSAVINYQAYQGAEWKNLNNLKPALSSIVDFGAGTHLKQHPDILQRHGYSTNDIDLIMNWFFVDPNITNSKTLLSMLAELGYLPDPGNALANAWIGVKSLWHQNLLALVLAAFLLLTLQFSWQVLMSWGLSIAAVFTFGLLGRPGALHVYVPLVSLLIIAPFLIEKLSPWRHYRFETVALVIAVIVNTADVFSESKTFQIATEQTHKELANFPNYPIVNWGTTFPFESVYPVLVVSPAAMSYQFYSLGSFTLAPFSVAFSEQQHGRGMTDLLIKETGVPIIGYDEYIKYLEIYCKEHFHGQLQELSVTKYGEIVVRQHRCEVKP